MSSFFFFWFPHFAVAPEMTLDRYPYPGEIIGNWFLKSSVECLIVENVVSHLSRCGYRGAADTFQYSRFFLLGMDSDKHRNASKIHIRLSHVDPRIIENVVSHLSRCGYRGAADTFQYSRFFLLGMDSDKHRDASKMHNRLSHTIYNPSLFNTVMRF